MASMIRKCLQAPLRMMLLCHFLSALATGGVVVWAVMAYKADPDGKGWLVGWGESLSAIATGAGGMTLMWLIVIPLGALLVASLVMGLTYGRWGLPMHLQGRAVYFVPPASAVYFAAGTLALFAVSGDGFAAGWKETTHLVTTSAGLTLVLIYACLATSAVGLGWSLALAVTRRKRTSGKWETIGYVEPQA